MRSAVYYTLERQLTTKVGVSSTNITVVTHIVSEKFSVNLLPEKMSTPKQLSDLIKSNGLTKRDLEQQMTIEHCHEIAMEVDDDWEP